MLIGPIYPEALSAAYASSALGGLCALGAYDTRVGIQLLRNPSGFYQPRISYENPTVVDSPFTGERTGAKTTPILWWVSCSL